MVPRVVSIQNRNNPWAEGFVPLQGTLERFGAGGGEFEISDLKILDWGSGK
jgi:hypothetical protein